MLTYSEKLIGTQNPFKTIVANLSEEWQPITLNYLKYIHDTINEETKLINTFGQAFTVLEYLNNNNAINLESDTAENTFKIRKAIYDGSK